MCIPIRLAARPDVAVPSQGRRLLDRHPRRDRRRQHLVAVGLILLVEQVERRQAHHPRAHPVGGQLLVRLHRQRNLAAGRDQDQLRVAAVGVGEHVAAAAQALGGGVLRAVEHRHVLAREHQRARLVLLAERHPPGLGDLVRVAGADHVEAGHRAQRGELLDRLVGRSVLAEADRVVGEDVDHRQLHQRREADRRARVVGEDEVGRPRRAQLREREPVRDRGRLVLADPVVEVAPAAVARLEVAGAVELQPHRGRVGEVGRAAHEPGQPLGDRVLDRLRGLAGRDAVGVGVEGRDLGVPAVGQLAALHRRDLRGELSVLVPVALEQLLPLLARPRARGCRCRRRSAPARRRGPGTARPRASRRCAWSP